MKVWKGQKYEFSTHKSGQKFKLRNFENQYEFWYFKICQKSKIGQSWRSKNKLADFGPSKLVRNCKLDNLQGKIPILVAQKGYLVPKHLGTWIIGFEIHKVNVPMFCQFQTT